ncbi:SsrA-binding protein [Humitalea rosea]|uniref:SsrA-binding protein n=1 Tax=Humitalea rosea TaxID=990373 RepID=A0A2W7IGB5_9PROT|nr:SsrA-binding protein SmpB [Humitalea rosea]PZW45591.1 SsrA-binding protein [Humitalea rosea]
MASTPKKKSLISHGTAAQNRKAHYDFKINETLEAGMVLLGGEVKSLRAGRAAIAEAWAGERDGEMWLYNCYIPEWQANSLMAKFEPRRPRKLLMSHKQIATWAGAVTRQGATIVPLEILFNEQGRAKVKLGLAEGKQAHDKRAHVAERDWARDKARVMRDKGRDHG